MRGRNCTRYPIQTEITTPQSIRHSECATIIHPFHSLKGERLKILSPKPFNRNEILHLENLAGKTIAIPREWTDRADPCEGSHGSSSILSFTHLLQLVGFVDDLKQAKFKKLKS